MHLFTYSELKKIQQTNQIKTKQKHLHLVANIIRNFLVHKVNDLEISLHITSCSINIFMDIQV